MKRKQHAMTRDAITPAIIRDDLDYDPLTGKFKWRAVRVGVTRGAEVGVVNKHGYVVIPLRRNIFQAHRLAWAHYFKEMPAAQIDHINGDKTDNRIANLRLATPSQNKANTEAQKNSASGLKGVSWHKKDRRWIARIQKNGSRVEVGRFKTAEEAAAAYDRACLEVFGEYGRANGPRQTNT